MPCVGLGCVNGGGSRAKNPSDPTAQNQFFFKFSTLWYVLDVFCNRK